jgi:hypothetical protein
MHCAEPTATQCVRAFGLERVASAAVELLVFGLVKRLGRDAELMDLRIHRPSEAMVGASVKGGLVVRAAPFGERRGRAAQDAQLVLKIFGSFGI